MASVYVDVAWLFERIDDPRLRIVDARNVPHGTKVALPSGLDQYKNGHLPQAIYLDYAVELADPATPYATRVAPGVDFARVVGERGIGDDAIVVAYDDGTIPFAARIVWNFQYYGHQAAYVLAGGIEAWLLAGHKLSDDVPEFAPARFSPAVQPRLRATREEVLAVVEGRLDEQLLDTQRDGNYALRAHDIKGAVRLSGTILNEDANGGRPAPRETVDALVAARNLDRGKRTIVSCGSGVSASGAFFALRQAGFTDVAVYDGSWMEWSHDGLPTTPKS